MPEKYTITEKDVEIEGFPEGSVGLEIEPEGEAWGDLIKGLEMIRRKPSADKTSPFNCSHDQLAVMVSPEDFDLPELAQLHAWGFSHSQGEDQIYSFRFGSA